MALLKSRETVMRRFRTILAEYDLSEQQWRVIRALHERDLMETGELADMVFLLGPSLTRILQRLEARGLIVRQRQDEDQRKITISITDEGRRLFALIAPISESEYRRIERTIGAKDIDNLMEALSRMTELLNDSDL